MIDLITFDKDDYALDMARITSSIVATCLILLLRRVSKQRKYVKGAYFSPVLVFTYTWLFVLLLVSAIPLFVNQEVITSGFLFAFLASAYVWSLAGMGLVLSNYVRSYDEIISAIQKITPESISIDKED
jgi:hypothetical protein